jgi:hypothetical protein
MSLGHGQCIQTIIEVYPEASYPMLNFQQWTPLYLTTTPSLLPPTHLLTTLVGCFPQALQMWDVTQQLPLYFTTLVPITTIPNSKLLLQNYPHMAFLAKDEEEAFPINFLAWQLPNCIKTTKAICCFIMLSLPLTPPFFMHSWKCIHMQHKFPIAWACCPCACGLVEMLCGGYFHIASLGTHISPIGLHQRSIRLYTLVLCLSRGSLG